MHREPLNPLHIYLILLFAFLQLSGLGIGADSIKFKNVTLQSSKYVCVREEGQNSVAIIDTATKNVLRLPVAVDSAIMNPISKVIALRGTGERDILLIFRGACGGCHL